MKEPPGLAAGARTLPLRVCPSSDSAVQAAVWKYVSVKQQQRHTDGSAFMWCDRALSATLPFHRVCIREGKKNRAAPRVHLTEIFYAAAQTSSEHVLLEHVEKLCFSCRVFSCFTGNVPFMCSQQKQCSSLANWEAGANERSEH